MERDFSPVENIFNRAKIPVGSECRIRLDSFLRKERLVEVGAGERLPILAFTYQRGLHSDRYNLSGEKKESRLSVVRVGTCEYRGKGTAHQVSVTVGWDRTEKEFLYDLFEEDKTSSPNTVGKWDTVEFISKEGVLARLRLDGFADSKLSKAVRAFKVE